MKRTAIFNVLAIIAVIVAATENEVTLFDNDNVLIVDQHNYLQVLEYVQQQEGILLLHTYKNDKGPSCVGINKNLRGIAAHIGKNETIKGKYFIGLGNLTENRPLESTYFVGMFPKIYYYAFFENMRKRKFEKNTAIGVVMKWFRELGPAEPVVLQDIKGMELKMRNDKLHMIFGIFSNNSDPIYTSQYIPMANFFSHLPVYTCYYPGALTDYLNLTISNDPKIVIYRKAEITPSDVSLVVEWNNTESLTEFIKSNYHLPVDIYTHDSKYLYDLHSDVVGLFYFSGANTLFHQGWNSPISKLLASLNKIQAKLEENKADFVSEESQARYDRFALALAFKQDFWYWSQILHLKMEMDFIDEFTPIVYDDRGKCTSTS